jgi:hypothetical protein
MRCIVWHRGGHVQVYHVSLIFFKNGHFIIYPARICITKMHTATQRSVTNSRMVFKEKTEFIEQ